MYEIPAFFCQWFFSRSQSPNPRKALMHSTGAILLAHFPISLTLSEISSPPYDQDLPATVDASQKYGNIRSPIAWGPSPNAYVFIPSADKTNQGPLSSIPIAAATPVMRPYLKKFQIQAPPPRAFLLKTPRPPSALIVSQIKPLQLVRPL